ncbi:MAG: 3-keto-disaccharide hydrolase, partial [Sphingobacterium sp.]
MTNSIILSSTILALLSITTSELPRIDQEFASIQHIDSQREGKWIDLLANNSLNAWHQYNSGSIKGWKVQDGILSTNGKNGDIVTNQEFDNFELEIDWKIEEAGNSGIFIYVIEHPNHKHMYQTGPEFQIIDNDNYPQQLTEQQKTGSMSDVLAPKHSPLNSAGQWNSTRIVSMNGKVQHWLNKQLILEYQIGSPALKEQIAKSKFAEMPYAKTAKGKIGLQDHGDPV